MNDERLWYVWSGGEFFLFIEQIITTEIIVAFKVVATEQMSKKNSDIRSSNHNTCSVRIFRYFLKRKQNTKCVSKRALNKY